MVGEVLVERAAALDVHGLAAHADAEGGELALFGECEHGQVEAGAVGIGEFGVGMLEVGHRVWGRGRRRRG